MVMVLLSIPSQSVPQQNKLTEKRHNPCELPGAYPVGKHSLKHREYGSSKHAHHKHPRGTRRVFAKTINSQGKHTALHDGMEKPYRGKKPKVFRQHGGSHERYGAKRDGDEHRTWFYVFHGGRNHTTD